MCAVMLICFEVSHKETGSTTLIPEITFHYQSLVMLNVLKSEVSFFRFDASLIIFLSLKF